ncbi:Ribosome biogenesis protein BOP1-like protein [Aphelenchoides bicaudatus]|nr:Ribosome biogenesis protein BOP1-like protein [Aphelenchoides bicaudatus]
MNDKWRSLFTPIDELNNVEPAMITVSNLDGFVDESFFERRSPCTANNPLALAEFICQRLYSDSPRILEHPETKGTGKDTVYIAKAMIGRRVGVGESKNLNDAKQLAAYNILLDIVNNDEYKKFDMVGETREEALAELQKINPQKSKPVSVQKPMAAKESNWVGQCTTLCVIKDLKAQPKYKFDDGVGPPHNKTFTCTAILDGYPDVKVTSTGSTKKAAKTEAARLILDKIKELPEGPGAEERRQKKALKQQQQEEFAKSGSSGQHCLAILKTIKLPNHQQTGHRQTNHLQFKFAPVY